MRITRLDGVRGLAIALVFAYHGAHLGIGWAGVDLFFVLSGYLMTRILLRDRNTEIFWLPFYMKRATRIIPPLLTCLALSAIFYPAEWHSLRLFILFFGANIGLAIFGGSGPLGVLWSLSVEEHFYFGWPLMLRRFSDSTLMKILTAIICIEPLLRALATRYTHTYWPIYILTPFRLDGLAAGALLAITIDKNRDLLKRISGKASLSLVLLLSLLAATGHFNYKANLIWFNALGYSLTVLIAVSFIAYVLLHERSWVSRLMESKPLTFLGKISYGLYLYHQFVLEAADNAASRLHIKHHALLLPVAVPVAATLSSISWKFYEEKLIKLGHSLAKGLILKKSENKDQITPAYNLTAE